MGPGNFSVEQTRKKLWEPIQPAQAVDFGFMCAAVVMFAKPNTMLLERIRLRNPDIWATTFPKKVLKIHRKQQPLLQQQSQENQEQSARSFTGNPFYCNMEQSARQMQKWQLISLWEI